MTFCLTEPTTSTNLVLWSKPKLELPIDARSAVLLLTVDTGYECNLASRSFTGRVVAGALAHCPLPSECGLNKSHNRYCNRVTNKQTITETCCQKRTSIITRASTWEMHSSCAACADTMSVPNSQYFTQLFMQH